MYTSSNHVVSCLINRWISMHVLICINCRRMSDSYPNLLTHCWCLNMSKLLHILFSVYIYIPTGRSTYVYIYIHEYFSKSFKEWEDWVQSWSAFSGDIYAFVGRQYRSVPAKYVDDIFFSSRNPSTKIKQMFLLFK